MSSKNWGMSVWISTQFWNTENSRNTLLKNKQIKAYKPILILYPNEVIYL